MSDHVDPSAVVAKAAPPVAYVGATLAGMTIEQWISALTVAYLVLAILSLVFPDWRKALMNRWRKWRS